MNDWKCIQSSDTKEEIVNIAWLHLGTKVCFRSQLMYHELSIILWTTNLVHVCIKCYTCELLQVSFNCDKKDSPIYTDKIARSKFKPSLSYFGGKPVDGWIAVTGTGLVRQYSTFMLFHY